MTTRYLMHKGPRQLLDDYRHATCGVEKMIKKQAGALRRTFSEVSLGWGGFDVIGTEAPDCL